MCRSNLHKLFDALQVCDSLRAHMAEQSGGMYAFQSPVEEFIVRYVMEQCAYVAVDYDKEIAKSNDTRTTVSLREFEPTKGMTR